MNKAPQAFLNAIEQTLRKIHPKYKDYYQTLRMPSFSLISVFGNQNSYTNTLITRNLQGHVIVPDAGQGVSNDQDSLVKFARKMTTVNSIDKSGGYVLYDFPQTASTADSFEEITDGINLAINFVYENQNDENTTDVTNYYESRGQLLTFTVDENESLDQASDRFLRDLRAKIKL